MSEKKYREFWVQKNLFQNRVTPWRDNPVKYKAYSQCVDLPGGFWKEESTLHVIDIAALTAKDKQIAELVEAIEDHIAYLDDPTFQMDGIAPFELVAELKMILKKHSKGGEGE